MKLSDKTIGIVKEWVAGDGGLPDVVDEAYIDYLISNVNELKKPLGARKYLEAACPDANFVKNIGTLASETKQVKPREEVKKLPAKNYITNDDGIDMEIEVHSIGLAGVTWRFVN